MIAVHGNERFDTRILWSQFELSQNGQPLVNIHSSSFSCLPPALDKDGVQ